MGLSDKTYIEIRSGLSESDEVALAPGALVSEKERKQGKEEEKMPAGAAKHSEGSDHASHDVNGQSRIKAGGASGGRPALQK